MVYHGEMENLNLNFTYNNKNHEYPKKLEKNILNVAINEPIAIIAIENLI